MLVKETSERSKSSNLVEHKIKNFNELIQIEFEGLSTKNGEITCFLDRGLTHLNISDFLKGDPIQEICINEPFLSLKKQLAIETKVPWLFVVYSYHDNKCVVYDLSNDFKIVNIFTSFAAFGNWFSYNYTDNTKFFSSYQETGLPEFDAILRKNGTPWAGNVDGILFFANNEKKIAIIEYQNTSKTSVKEHENNNYLKASIFRKGDNKRWKVHHSLAEHTGIKVLVIVWSKNETVVGLKPVKSFDIGSDGYVSHINWGECLYIDLNELTPVILLSAIF